MASIRKERSINVSPELAWAALSDWGALGERLVPGFVVDVRQDGEDRIVTFFNEMVARERRVDVSETDRRLVWTVVDGRFAHYNGAAQVHPKSDGTTSFVWITNLLPDDLAGAIDQMMERGIDTIKRTLEAARVDGNVLTADNRDDPHSTATGWLGGFE